MTATLAAAVVAVTAIAIAFYFADGGTSPALVAASPHAAWAATSAAVAWWLARRCAWSWVVPVAAVVTLGVGADAEFRSDPVWIAQLVGFMAVIAVVTSTAAVVRRR